MITLVIINCQNDFISGTMSLKGAKSALENIKKFIKDNKKEIEKIIFTVDWHPYNHTSFAKYGGVLPSHCVQYTPGACIEPKLLKFIQSTEISYEVTQIGTIEEVDEIGAFYEIEYSQDSLGSRYYFDSIITANGDTEFVVCGLYEGVKATIKNLIDENITPKVLLSGIVSSDINKFIEENKLENVLK